MLNYSSADLSAELDLLPSDLIDFNSLDHDDDGGDFSPDNEDQVDEEDQDCEDDEEEDETEQLKRIFEEFDPG